MIEITEANRHALRHCALTYVACAVFTYYIYIYICIEDGWKCRVSIGIINSLSHILDCIFRYNFHAYIARKEIYYIFINC